jgi:hypothetical protein
MNDTEDQWRLRVCRHVWATQSLYEYMNVWHCLTIGPALYRKCRKREPHRMPSEEPRVQTTVLGMLTGYSQLMPLYVGLCAMLQRGKSVRWNPSRRIKWPWCMKPSSYPISSLLGSVYQRSPPIISWVNGAFNYTETNSSLKLGWFIKAKTSYLPQMHPWRSFIDLDLVEAIPSHAENEQNPWTPVPVRVISQRRHTHTHGEPCSLWFFSSSVRIFLPPRGRHIAHLLV